MSEQIFEDLKAAEIKRGIEELIANMKDTHPEQDFGKPEGKES